MEWITENIAIGYFTDAREVSTGDVEAILCLLDGCCDEADKQFDVVNIPLVDGTGNDLRALREAITFINDVVTGGPHSGALPCGEVALGLRGREVSHGLSRHHSAPGAGSDREEDLHIPFTRH